MTRQFGALAVQTVSTHELETAMCHCLGFLQVCTIAAARKYLIPGSTIPNDNPGRHSPLSYGHLRQNTIVESQQYDPESQAIYVVSHHMR